MNRKNMTIIILSITLLSAVLIGRVFMLPAKSQTEPADSVYNESELSLAAADEIIWKDNEFKEYVCQQLGVGADQLTSADLNDCVELYISASTITTIEDLVYFPNLEILYLNNINISDYSSISALPALKELFIISCGLTDISFLEGLSGLTHLSLYGNEISDITPLKDLTDLVELSLSFNSEIADISVLGGMTKLEDLGIAACNISDLSPLANITVLRNVNFNANKISDLSPLAELTGLEGLGAAFNQISDLSPLSNLDKLMNVSLSYNEITDISPLQNAIDIQWLSFDNNRVTDLSPLAEMKQLFYLNGRQNSFADISTVLFVPDLEIGNYSIPYPFDEEQLEQNQALGEQLLKEYYPNDNAKYEDLQAGDLNGDEYGDIIIVAQVENEIKGEAGRNLYIFTGNEDGSYTPFQVLPTVGANGGGIYGDPYQGVQLAKGILLVHIYGGSNWRWGYRDVYRCEGNQLVPVMQTKIASVVWSGHYQVIHDDYENNRQQAYMYYGSHEQRLEAFLYKDESLDREWSINNIYPVIPGIDSDEKILENIPSSDKDGEDIIRMIFDSYFDEGEIQAIPYTEQTKNSYDRLLGVKVPSFYYETKWQGIPGILAYQDMSESENGDLIHQICFYGMDEDLKAETMFYYNEETEEIKIK